MYGVGCLHVGLQCDAATLDDGYELSLRRLSEERQQDRYTRSTPSMLTSQLCAELVEWHIQAGRWHASLLSQ